MVHFLTTLLSRLFFFVVPELLDLASALGDHLLNRLALQAQVVLVLHIVLHLSHLVLLELVFDGLGALQL